MERFGRPWLWLFTCLTLVSLFQLMQCAAADGESWQIFIVSFFFYVRPFLAYWANIWRGVNEEITTGFLLLFYLKKKKMGENIHERKRGNETKLNWIDRLTCKNIITWYSTFISLLVCLSLLLMMMMAGLFPSFLPSIKVFLATGFFIFWKAGVKWLQDLFITLWKSWKWQLRFVFF